MKTSLQPIKLTSALLLTALWCFPTSAQTPFEKADSIAAAFDEPYENAEELALKLTATLSSDKEKARVFFMWIAHNVRYDCDKYHHPVRPQFRAPTQEKLREEMDKWKESQIEKTVKSKKGVCADYSQLFKALCDAVGLEAVVVTGDARDPNYPYRTAFNNPHAWNAVKIENEWRLLDATWGAGYTDPEVSKFYRRVAPGYFFSPPDLFSLNHFPDDPKWQLLAEPLSKEDYPNQPVINYGQTEYRITAFATAVRTVPEKANEKEIWLLFENAPLEMMVTTRKGRSVEFQRTIENSKVILSFPGATASSVIIFGGKSLRSRMEWMAMYEL